MVRFLRDDRERPTASQVPLQVIAAGAPRSATSSMQAAMEQLGYAPCLHMAQIVPHADRSRMMIEAIEERDTARRQKLVHQLVDGYASICDFPVCFFTPDLMDMYPGVKVVLNQRDSGEVWARSAWESLGFLFTWKYWLVGRLILTDRLWYRMNMSAVKYCEEKYKVNGLFNATVHDMHYQMVRDEAAKRGVEVLEFRAEQGWEPLCKFLGKEVPDTEFPRLNEAKTFAIIKTIVITRGLLAYAALGGGIWAAWRYGPSGLDLLRNWVKS